MQHLYIFIRFVFLGLLLYQPFANAQTSTLPIKGWAKNLVNAVIFRKNSVVTYGNDQYVAYYNGDGFVVLGKRKLGTTDWQTKTTSFKGNVLDAHNSISIMVDGAGFLHLAWDHHNTALNYTKSTVAGSLEMGAKTAMIGTLESKLSYPEFHRLPNGHLLFMYRDGASGNGNLVINSYNPAQKTWQRLHSTLINGEGQRNAYWQTFVDTKGTVHLSWVWRETSDVATNHDLCYARSSDGGKTWQKTTGANYTLPITASTAEYALKIAQNSELINQTSIYGDSSGRPYVCSYWTPTGSDIPQYQVVYQDGSKWRSVQASNRTTPFSLSGSGTKKIPISRPQIVVQQAMGKTNAYILYRDVEQSDRPSLLYTSDLASNKWKTINLSNDYLGSWEPSFDTELWKTQQLLHVFVQRVGQGDGESLENLDPQPVTILEWNPQEVVTSMEDVETLPEAGISAAPNPFTAYTVLQTPIPLHYWVYNQSGEMVETGGYETGKVLGATWPKGFYLLQLATAYGHKKWCKLIKAD